MAFKKELLISICLGLLVGGLTTLFIQGLFFIEAQQLVLNEQTWPVHLFFLPLVLVFLFLLKKRTLYFPTRVSELVGWKEDSCDHWNAWMTPFNFLGTWIGHAVGASVGREGAVVVVAAGLVRAFSLSWKFWGPVAMGCGFSAVLENPWVGVIFIGELFSTSLKQKIFLLISSLVATLLMQTLQVPHLLPSIDLQEKIGFFKLLGFILTLSVVSGLIMRGYKFIFLRLSPFFRRQNLFVKFVFALVLMSLLMIPELRKFQSLGILQLTNLADLQLGYEIPFLKLVLTLFSVTLGFWGGEFIPLIYAGLHFGANVASTFGLNQLMGTYFGCFLFFAGATRLKWTGFFLLLSLLGFSWVIWILFLVHLTVGFSGDESLYQPHE